MNSWRPIETAPKDGTYILLYEADTDAPNTLIGRWRNNAWHSEPTMSGRSIVWRFATYWMPLPAPPGPNGGQDD